MKESKMNRICCLKCGDTIQSVNMQWCNCGAIAIDGGEDYGRFTWGGR